VNLRVAGHSEKQVLTLRLVPPPVAPAPTTGAPQGGL
jgi:hypothetical protein